MNIAKSAIVKFSLTWYKQIYTFISFTKYGSYFYLVNEITFFRHSKHLNHIVKIIKKYQQEYFHFATIVIYLATVAVKNTF